MFTNAVFQGGGVKGIALVGALKRIEEIGVKFNAVGGTSAGSIVAALYAAGYTAEEMKQLLEQTAFDALLDSSKIPAATFLRHRGIYRGKKIYEWMYQCLERKGVRIFRDLDSKEIDLKIVASDLTNRELLKFDRRSYPTMKIAEAVRMSISIPLFFEPYKLGERLVVDGGVLSNYPLFIFDEPEKTVGFKLISKTSVVPTAPSSWAGYLASIINTMMDAHDKEDEKQAGYQNTVHIDNAGIPTTKFDLTSIEKSLLFNNGYYAASQFLNERVEVLRNIKDKFIRIESPFSQPLTVNIPEDLEPNELIRVSISGLFRICVDGRFLLVRGMRILNQYQPVGGVFKRLPKSTYYLQELGVLDDDKLPIDDDSRDDLRIRVPLEALPKFLEWYRTEKGREVTPEREFREELLETNLLARDQFKYIFYERIRTHVTGIKRSHHFDCNEILIAEIYELNMTPDQAIAFRDLQRNASEQYLWCDEALIRSKGYDQNKKADIARIGETAEWIL